MGETLKLSFRLFLFMLIAALALAVTNEITKGPIAEQSINKANAARAKALPGADEYAELEIINPEQYPGILELHEVIRDGEPVGYTFTARVTGYKGPIIMTLAVNKSGSVNSLVINSQTETAGLGNKVADEPFLSQFTGVAASPDVIAHDVDTISGATVSSSAVKSGAELVLKYAQNELGIEANAGEIITAHSAELYNDIEQATGAKRIAEMDAFESIGFPGIRNAYTAMYNGTDSLIIEFDSGMVITSMAGEVLSTTGSPTEVEQQLARGYAAQYAGNGELKK